VGGWLATQRCVPVRFDEAAAFFNANTLADLQRPSA
jgi:molybdopterin-guanine dinucleotide biosynthesis protein A